MCHGLAETRYDTIQYDVAEIMVCYLGIDNESIHVVLVFLDSTSLLEITDLVESLVPIIVLAIVFPNAIIDFLSGRVPVPVSFPLLLCFTFYTWTNVSKSLLFITSLCDGNVIIHLKDLLLQVHHITT